MRSCTAYASFTKIFSGREPLQDVKVLQCSRDIICPHLQGAEDGDGVRPQNVGENSYFEAAVCPRSFY